MRGETPLPFSFSSYSARPDFLRRFGGDEHRCDLHDNGNVVNDDNHNIDSDGDQHLHRSDHGNFRHDLTRHGLREPRIHLQNFRPGYRRHE
jgi:hypothetical protein